VFPQPTEANRPPIVPPHLAGSTHDRQAKRTDDARADLERDKQPESKPQDGTEEMTLQEQQSAGIIDDAGRKVPPTNAFLIVAMLFIFGIAVVILALVLVMQVFHPIE
jgi:hypothetical protein